MMKTLIFNGSPNKTGDTVALIDEFSKHILGEVKILSCHSDISPCTDCRYCWQNPGCSINDGMQDVYPFLDSCDNIVLASPIWFSSLSGPLLNLASRIQTLYAARCFRGEAISMKQKNGVLILVGAEKGTEAIPTQNALTIMKFMGVRRAGVIRIYSLDTNHVPAILDGNAMRQAREAAITLNDAYQKNNPV